jgi:hypothetical protein
MVQKIYSVTMKITQNFVTLDIKAKQNFTLQFMRKKICAWDDFYFTLIFRIKILKQWYLRNFTLLSKNPILQSNFTLQFVL